MNNVKAVTKDPICGMAVDESTALHAEHKGKTFYFCSEGCRKKFLAKPDDLKPVDQAKGCCCG